MQYVSRPRGLLRWRARCRDVSPASLSQPPASEQDCCSNQDTGRCVCDSETTCTTACPSLTLDQQPTSTTNYTHFRVILGPREVAGGTQSTSTLTPSTTWIGCCTRERKKECVDLDLLTGTKNHAAYFAVTRSTHPTSTNSIIYA